VDTKEFQMSYRVRIQKIVHELTNTIDNIERPTETYKDDQEYFKEP
jgi:molecular chaperone GrpE (heat shock protein)